MPLSRQQLGSLIREARETRGLSLTAAAEKLGIDKGYYSKIETGRVALGKHAKAVAKLYGLAADELDARAAATWQRSPALPNYRPYLRAKFDLPDEAIAELETHFKEVAAKHKRGKR